MVYKTGWQFNTLYLAFFIRLFREAEIFFSSRTSKGGEGVGA